MARESQNNSLRILGIETSCDETAAAVVADARKILSSVVASQLATHGKYGGVVPELASREHLRAIVPVVTAALDQAGCDYRGLAAVAVTSGPGLVGSLLVGMTYAKALCFAHNLPLIAVNHVEGHIHAVVLESQERGEPVEYPALALVASGGHTHLFEMREGFQYRLLGRTRDDAAGEAFDKTAQLLGLGYPGGPALSKLAATGDASRFTLPRPMLNSGDFDFSFSGLKTAVLTLVRKAGLDQAADIAAAFQAAAVDVLVKKSLAACAHSGATRLVVAGGVGANSHLRERLTRDAAARGISVFYPRLEFCTDNGAMIAYAGAQRLMSRLNVTLAQPDLAFAVKPRWELATLDAV